MNALLDARTRDDSADLFTVRFEDLVSSPEQVVKDLCAFLGLSYRTEMLDVARRNTSYAPSRQDRSGRGIDAGSRDRWRGELTATETWLVERICRSPMRELGYRTEAKPLGPADWPQAVAIAFLLPGRLFNMLFRGRKTPTVAKLKKVIGATRRS
jgi:hypothetical protein